MLDEEEPKSLVSTFKKKESSSVGMHALVCFFRHESWLETNEILRYSF